MLEISRKKNRDRIPVIFSWNPTSKFQTRSVINPGRSVKPAFRGLTQTIKYCHNFLIGRIFPDGFYMTIFNTPFFRLQKPDFCQSKSGFAVFGKRPFRLISALLSLFFLTEKVWSAGEAATGGEKTAPKPTAIEQFFPFILLGLFFYFILIRPQQKKAKSHNQFLAGLKRGDEVLTTGGIFGSIEGLTDQFVILEVAENVRIRIMKSQIASHTKSLTNGEKR